MPRKPKPPTCEDCYFHKNMLCALELNEPCTTFRPNRPEGLVPRAAGPHAPPLGPVPLTAGRPRWASHEPPAAPRLSPPERRAGAMFWPCLSAICSLTSPGCGGRWTRCWAMLGPHRYVSRRSTGFSPNVDVYYCGDPQRAVVKVDLAGVELSEVGIEVSGRQLAIVGERPVQETEGRVYQQVEIPSGPFRRVVELQVEVDAERAKATYEDGVLRIELPLRDPAETTRRVPIGRRVMEGTPVLEVVESPLDAEDAIRADQPLPDALPVLPLRETVTFPETLTPLAVGQERSIKLVDDVLGANRMLAMVAARDPENEEPGPGGPLRGRRRRRRRPHAQGPRRDAAHPRPGDPAGAARPLRRRAALPGRPDRRDARHDRGGPELEALTRNVQRTFSEIVEQIPYLPEELQMAVANIDDPAALAHLIAGTLRIATEEKQELLEEVDVAERLRHLSRILARELEVVQLGTQIQTQVQSEIDKGQREFFLRQQLKAIQEELGEGDEQQAEVNELREKIEAAKLPEHALKPPSASSRGWRSCCRPRPSTASSAPTSSG